MGSYTGIRFKAVIKPKYHNYINELVCGNIDSLVDLYKQHADIFPFLKEFVETKQYAEDLIVAGGRSYMPDTWDYDDIPEGSESYNLFYLRFKKSSGVLQFHTVNKNIGNTMEFFLENVAHHLIDNVIAIYLHHDEQSVYRCYDLVDGKLEEVALININLEGFSYSIHKTNIKEFSLTEEWKRHLDWNESCEPRPEPNIGE